MIFFDFNKKKAQKLHDKAEGFSEEGKTLEAIELYLKAIELNPDRSASFYNIGLIYKYQGDWEKSFEFNSKAYSLDSKNEAARWNMAIAATALRKWAVVSQGLERKWNRVKG